MGSQVTGKILGIDAGGTFTDLALLSEKELSVEDFVKVSTNKENMADTIKTGLKQILEKTGADGIRSISLATTFATNALVENKVRETALILIGYDPERVEAARRHGKFPTERIITISGGHDMKGNEKAALDIEALVPWLNENIPHVESVAVSAFFSVRNPSHELRIRELIYSMFNGKYVTCGHELTSDLDAMLRAVTASLNANLIPIIIDLFESVEKVFRNEGIAAPISVVKSDGTLVGLEWAKLHPIETILSGPAASAVGANHLACAGKLGKPSWVVDIGGTTTDIIHLDAGGSPALRAEGATIGSHKTLIKTIDIYTFGLGGDSRIYGRGRDGRIVVGPGRVSPLCRCLMENHVVGAEALNTTVFFDEPIIIIPADAGDFYDDFERMAAEKLKEGPMSAQELLKEERLYGVGLRRLENMEERGLVSFGGFTPTDMLHVLGKLKKWDVAAARIGAECLAKGGSAVSFSAEVYKTIIHHIAYNVLCKSFERSGREISRDGGDGDLISDSLYNDYNDKSCGPKVRFELDGVLIGAGAPAWAFIEDTAAALGCEFRLPEFSEVTGAVGAAAGTFLLNYTVWINPIGGGRFRSHLPFDIKDFEDAEDAVSYTLEVMTPWLRDRSLKAGASDPIIEYERNDEIVSAGGSRVHIWTELAFKVREGDVEASNIMVREGAGMDGNN
ncbi:hydantoinase/oxoprolinase N-terminal domain-containing protein [Cloacibacillus evryensis]